MPIAQSRDEIRAWLNLLRAPALGSPGVRALIARHGKASAAVAAAVRSHDIASEARDWLGSPDAGLLANDLDWLDTPQHHLLTFGDSDYPSLLKEIGNPPAALFVDGDVDCLWSAQIAIVGSRNATAGGIANARAFARTFSLAGNVVTSGLAEGIDGAAHTGALDAGGKTIAVLGTGPDLVYPRQHRELAARIAQSGALISEFPPGTPGKPKHFPSRNRIIAGLSLGTLIVEAGLKSGSLITARAATEAGREVFALPGSIHNPLARGCHRMIRNGAKLVETAEEVIEELTGVSALLADGLRARLATTAPDKHHSNGADRESDPEYARLLQALGPDPCALDELVERTGFPAAALSSMLLVLELDGKVSAEHGRYARID